MKYLMTSKCFTESKTYIKTFENIKNYKRYIIFPFVTALSSSFYILEVLQEDESFIVLRKSYKYYDEYKGKPAFGIQGLEELYGDTIKFTPERMKNAVYQSDNIQDCLDKLPVIKNMMKYNII